MKVKYSYLDIQLADSEEILEGIRGLLKDGLFPVRPASGGVRQMFTAFNLIEW